MTCLSLDIVEKIPEQRPLGFGICRSPSPADRVHVLRQRGDSWRRRSAGGTGLGLVIALDITRAHGGSIEITDSPLGGARFVVTLAGSGMTVS